MRRRAARGGRDTPPLPSDDSDQEQGSGSRGNNSTSQHPPPNAESEEASRDNDHSENESNREPNTGSGGLVDRIHSGDTNGSDVITDEVGGANRSSNTALDRLTMDAYGSSDEDN